MAQVTTPNPTISSTMPSVDEQAPITGRNSGSETEFLEEQLQETRSYFVGALIANMFSY
jgi:hypothetical protein